MTETGLEALIDGANDYEFLTHYNGEVVLEYSHSLHAYTVVEDDVRYIVPGSTTVVGMIDKSGPLTQWAANETVHWIISNFPAELARPALAEAYTRCKDRAPWEDGALNKPNTLSCGVVPLAELLNAARFNYRTISTTATDIGKIAHNWLERYIKDIIAGNDVLVGLAPENEKSANCVEAALKWFDRHKFRPVFAEKKLYSRTHGYAGTCDWLAYVTSCGDRECCPFDGEELVLGDFKSSKHLYDEYFCQLASYRFAIEEEFPHLKIGACMLLRLGKEDGEFEVRTATQEEFDADFDGFLGCLQMYHWQKQRDLNKRYEKEVAKAQKNADKEAEKLAARLAKEIAKAAKAAASPARSRRPTKRAVVREIVCGIEIEVEGAVSSPKRRKKAAPKLSSFIDIPIEGA